MSTLLTNILCMLYCLRSDKITTWRCPDLMMYKSADHVDKMLYKSAENEDVMMYKSADSEDMMMYKSLKSAYNIIRT